MPVETLAAHWYTGPEHVTPERQRVFAPAWQVVTASARIPNVGDAIGVDAAGWPVVVVRREEGLVAFHNVCRHRAGPLVWEGEVQSRCKRLRCRYHGWQYDLDGALVRAPDFGGEATPRPLHPVAVGEWNGLVFVCVGDPEAVFDVGRQLPALARAFGRFDLGSWCFGELVRHELACNWKTYVENYLEGYHIPYLHPSLSKEVDVPRYRVIVDGDVCLHEVPTREGATNDGVWAWVWPNLALNVYDDAMSIERILPTGPTTMRIEYTYLHAPGAEAKFAAGRAISEEVTREDIAIVEAVQKNLEAGIYEVGELSPKHEGGVAAFQARYRGAMGDRRS